MMDWPIYVPVIIIFDFGDGLLPALAQAILWTNNDPDWPRLSEIILNEGYD